MEIFENPAVTNIVLTSGITLSGWTPVDISGKNFYGNGHTVAINGFNNATGSGLFGTVEGGMVRDLTVQYSVPSTITVANQNFMDALEIPIFGGVAGVATGNTRFENVLVVGSVSTSSNVTTSVIGGVTGLFTGNINNAYSNTILTVSGNGTLYAGGIIGWSLNSNLESCVFDGEVKSNGTINATGLGVVVGGIIGTNSIESNGHYTINDCSMQGIININANGPKTIGGVIGTTRNDNSTVNKTIKISNTFFNKGSITVEGSGETLVGGFAGQIGIVSGGAGVNMHNINNCGTLAETTLSVITSNGKLSVGGFTSEFVGDISNCFSGADIIVDHTNGYLNAGGFLGILSYYTSASSISRCYASGSIRSICKSTGNNDINIGGLVGSISNNNGALINSYALGNVFADRQETTGTGRVYAGGLVGRNYGSITKCFSTGEVIAHAYASGTVYAGGIVGYGENTVTGTSDNASIRDVAALGSKIIRGSGGGYAGRNAGNSTSLYNNYAINSMLIGNGSYNQYITGSVPSEYKFNTGLNGVDIGVEIYNTGWWGNAPMFFSSQTQKNENNEDVPVWDLSSKTIVGYGHPLLLLPDGKLMAGQE